jgi:catechol 2,3-dioxygenase-like lactoylglutathione lyase family enzyme
MIHHVAMRTRELDRLVRFYREVFSLDAVRERPGASVWLSLKTAVLMLERADAHEPAVPAGTMEFLAFAVTPERRAEIEATLVTLGIPVESRTEHTLYLRDPDGRRVGVSSYPLPV